MGKGFLYGNSGNGGSSGGTLTVTAPAGVTVTVSKDGKTYTKTADTSGNAVFKGLKSGTWTVTITDGSQTATRSVVVTADYAVNIAFFTATISVTYPAGSTCTCSCDGTTYTAPNTSGSYAFKVHKIGTWTIKATDGDESESATVTITSDGQSESVELSFVKIYGISRDITSTPPAWARTDLAVDMTASASVGTTAGESDFDNCAPWSGMARETLYTGDVMVKIPKFYFQRYREGNVEYLKIADKKKTGFTLHPLFNHGGVECDYAYVGAYKTSSNNKSVSGASPTVSATRATFRTNAKSKGTGWSLIDIAAVSAIQMLALVEFDTNNIQAVVGRGYCDSNSAALKSGSCDSVPNLTGRPSGTDGKTGVVYRGIEDFWGNIWEWVDGVNFNGGTYYVCNTQANYADDTASNYEKLSFTGATSWLQSYITEEGLDSGDNAHVMLPAAAGSGSGTTYMCDAAWSSTDWRVFKRGGAWADGSPCGLFTDSLYSDSSASAVSIGSRLLYIPS